MGVRELEVCQAQSMANFVAFEGELSFDSKMNGSVDES
jgi:hypothetical protein